MYVVHKLIFRTGWGLKPTSFTSLNLILDSLLRITYISIIFLLQMWQQRIGDLDIGFLNVILKEHANIYLENVVVLKKDNINANRRKVNRKVFYSTNFYFPSQACGGKLEMLFEVRQWNKTYLLLLKRYILSWFKCRLIWGSWSIKLKYDVEVCSCSMKLKYVVEVCSWSMEL